jgi:hypothetical protein
MEYEPNIKKIRFQKTAIYEIVVKGKLEKSWSEKPGGMQITVQDSPVKGPISTLVGKITDQPALAGALNALVDAHLTIVSVNALKRYQPVERYIDTCQWW